jgi:hypothetical protein
MLFGAQTAVLRNKSEVALHQQIGDYSEQSVLHHGNHLLLLVWFKNRCLRITRIFV